MDDVTLERLADLVVGFGANVQPGQIVAVSGEPGKEPLVRAIAAAAYKRGAKFVDVQWFDPWVKRARIEHAADDTLDFVPPWYGERVLALGEHRAARIALSGPVAPGVLDGLDPVRAGRDRLPGVKESGQVVDERTTNWSIIPAPTTAWATLVFPDVPEEEAIAELDRHLLHILRLDEPDPIAAWRARAERLSSNAARLTDRGFDALHYEGPGTDFTVGLLHGARWMAASFETVDGIEHMPNLPTEEIFTSPDPTRLDGHVSATMPLVLTDGTVVRGLKMRFEGGRVTAVDADTAQDVMRTIVQRDEGAARLGELALVDDEGRIGAMETVYYDTLLDENAASHIALGRGFAFLAPGQEDLVNDSEIHIDFMIGSPQLDVTGITGGGERVPILRGGSFVL
ncbi:MAG TPA: aminopeptidase [Solirubrobacteraceae bacterium]|nr:aminopeptidase [Solirubrobacteraceae bacterium]